MHTDMGPKLSFSCSQKWETMELRGADRHCQSCKKNVVDFTEMDRDAIRTYFKAQPATCGRFRTEQVEPRMVPLTETFGPLRAGIFALLTTLSIHSASAQEPAPTEQIASPDRDASNASSEKYYMNNAVIKMTPGGPVCMKQEPVVQRTSRKRLFLSDRFPFVHFRSRTRLGRYSMGCPSF